MWDVFQWVAAVVGFVGGALALWDRYVTQHPTAYLIAKPLDDFGSRTVYLRVTNRSDRPLIVRFPKRREVSQLTVMLDHSTRAGVAVLVSNEPGCVVDGMTNRDFPVLKPAGLEDLDPTTALSLELHWAFVDGAYRLLRRRKTIRTTRYQVEALEAGTDYVGRNTP